MDLSGSLVLVQQALTYTSNFSVPELSGEVRGVTSEILLHILVSTDLSGIVDRSGYFPAPVLLRRSMSDKTPIDELVDILKDYEYNLRSVDNLPDYLFLQNIMDVKLRRQHRNIVQFLDS